MTTSSPKSYNYLALRGAGVDDMEFVEQFGLDPAVAYTPRINEVMLERTHKEQLDIFLDEGMELKDAQARADMNKANAARDLKELMAKKGML